MYEVVAYVAGERIVFARSPLRLGARVLRARWLWRNFLACLALFVRTGYESDPMRFAIERV